MTPFGLMRETSLSRDVIESAAERLRCAGVLEVLSDDERGIGRSAQHVDLGAAPSVGFVHGMLTLAYAVCADETPLRVGPKKPTATTSTTPPRSARSRISCAANTYSET